MGPVEENDTSHMSHHLGKLGSWWRKFIKNYKFYGLKITKITVFDANLPPISLKALIFLVKIQQFKIVTENGCQKKRDFVEKFKNWMIFKFKMG